MRSRDKLACVGAFPAAESYWLTDETFADDVLAKLNASSRLPVPARLLLPDLISQSPMPLDPNPERAYLDSSGITSSLHMTKCCRVCRPSFPN